MNECPAAYTFKLRHNIPLEGDLLLARLELEAFLGDVFDVPRFRDAVETAHWSDLAADVRPQGQQGYRATAPLATLPELIRRLTFIQSIYCLTDNTPQTQAFVRELEVTVGPVVVCQAQADRLAIRAVPHYALMELADVTARQTPSAAQVKGNLSLLVDGLLKQTDNPRALKLAEKALSAQATTSLLTHDIHYYKAKFFPRMVRAMLNICARQIETPQPRVIDNFAGSGTTLLEASLLGMSSVGLDIDPLSVLISRTKTRVMHLESDRVQDEVARAVDRLHALETGQQSLFDPLPPTDNGGLTFPDWLLKNRKMTPALADELGREMDRVRRVIHACDPYVRDLFRVLLSDAIARRIRMRFLGTGVGRFSLTFSKRSLAALLTQSLTRYLKVVLVCEWLRETLHLQPAESEVLTADTRNLPTSIGTFDLLMTSPPYLPASSGRESYAKARAPSLLALEMATLADVDSLVDDAIGSMNAAPMDFAQLSPDQRDLVNWLQQDDLRAIKAEPTARYFLDMRQTFAEMHRVLRPGGMAVVVSGKQNTFYRFSTREVLYVVQTAALLADEARQAGFEVVALYDMPLKKANRNARPRSLDDYYETLIVLRRG